MSKDLTKFIKSASRIQVVSGYRLIKENYISKNKIIAKRNALTDNAVRSVKKHCSNNTNYNLNERDVRIYIAASSISHLLDGWSYLNNAVNSLLNGNESIAIHLAYYSELRAVMSLLSSEGVSVLDNKHLAIYNGGTFGLYPSGKAKLGTHIFAWDALKTWTNLSNKPPYNILKIFSVKGKNFSQLTEGFHPSATALLSTLITKKWLTNWALDVNMFRKDRHLRNNVSYRPQLMADFTDKFKLKDILINVYNLFQTISPSGLDNFHLLDRILLSDLYKQIYSTLSNNFFLAPADTYENLVENAFSHLGENLDFNLRSILLSTNEHPILIESQKREVSALPVITRAIFLLRISTGLISLLLNEADIRKDDLRFIWERYGFNHGFWSKEASEGSYVSLWSEVEENYQEMLDGLDELPDNPYNIKSKFESEINLISQLNRAAVWGI